MMNEDDEMLVKATALLDQADAATAEVLPGYEMCETKLLAAMDWLLGKGDLNVDTLAFMAAEIAMGLGIVRPNESKDEPNEMRDEFLSPERREQGRE